MIFLVDDTPKWTCDNNVANFKGQILFANIHCYYDVYCNVRLLILSTESL